LDIVNESEIKMDRFDTKRKGKATANPQSIGIFGGYSAPPMGGGSFGSAPPLFSSGIKGNSRDFITGAPLNNKRRLL
jgi:hypothetical protein